MPTLTRKTPKKPEPKPMARPSLVWSRCLGPGEVEHKFWSEGDHNRVCADCRSKQVAMHLSAALCGPAVRDPDE